MYVPCLGVRVGDPSVTELCSVLGVPRAPFDSPTYPPLRCQAEPRLLGRQPHARPGARQVQRPPAIRGVDRGKPRRAHRGQAAATQKRPAG